MLLVSHVFVRPELTTDSLSNCSPLRCIGLMQQAYTCAAHNLSHCGSPASLSARKFHGIRKQHRTVTLLALTDSEKAGTQGQLAAMLEDKRKVISDSIRVVPDFPKQGIMFQDITTLILDPIAFQYCIEDFVDHFRDQQVDVIAGIAILQTPHTCCLYTGKLPWLRSSCSVPTSTCYPVVIVPST